MKVMAKERAAAWKVNADELFRRLGLEPVDPNPIAESIREANHVWRAARMERIARYAGLVNSHDVALYSPLNTSIQRSKDHHLRKTPGRRRRVVCLELQLVFSSVRDAARYVHRNSSNIHQSIKKGHRCGPYHWDYV